MVDQLHSHTAGSYGLRLVWGCVCVCVCLRQEMKSQGSGVSPEVFCCTIYCMNGCVFLFFMSSEEEECLELRLHMAKNKKTYSVISMTVSCKKKNKNYFHFLDQY